MVSMKEENTVRPVFGRLPNLAAAKDLMWHFEEVKTDRMYLYKAIKGNRP